MYTYRFLQVDANQTPLHEVMHFSAAKRFDADELTQMVLRIIAVCGLALPVTFAVDVYDSLKPNEPLQHISLDIHA